MAEVFLVNVNMISRHGNDPNNYKIKNINYNSYINECVVWKLFSRYEYLVMLKKQADVGANIWENVNKPE